MLKDPSTLLGKDCWEYCLRTNNLNSKQLNNVKEIKLSKI